MAVFKVDYLTNDGQMGFVFVADSSETLVAEQARDLIADQFGRAGSGHRIDMRSITGAMSDGSPAPDDTLIVESYEGTWVTYLLIDTLEGRGDEADIEIYGSESDKARWFDAKVRAMG